MLPLIGCEQNWKSTFLFFHSWQIGYYPEDIKKIDDINDNYKYIL